MKGRLGGLRPAARARDAGRRRGRDDPEAARLPRSIWPGGGRSLRQLHHSPMQRGGRAKAGRRGGDGTGVSMPDPAGRGLSAKLKWRPDHHYRSSTHLIGDEVSLQSRQRRRRVMAQSSRCLLLTLHQQVLPQFRGESPSGLTPKGPPGLRDSSTGSSPKGSTAPRPMSRSTVRRPGLALGPVRDRGGRRGRPMRGEIFIEGLAPAAGELSRRLRGLRSSPTACRSARRDRHACSMRAAAKGGYRRSGPTSGLPASTWGTLRGMGRELSGFHWPENACRMPLSSGGDRLSTWPAEVIDHDPVLARRRSAPASDGT